jgi:hypothetical protein
MFPSLKLLSLFLFKLDPYLGVREWHFKDEIKDKLF